MSDGIRIQDYADAFADHIGGKGSTFTRNDFAEWLGVEPDVASSMLQVHRLAHRLATPELRPRFVFERENMGRATEWRVAVPSDAVKIIKRTTRERTEQILRDIELRAEPAAMSSPKAVRDIEVMVGAVEFAVEYLMRTLGIDKEASAA